MARWRAAQIVTIDPLTRRDLDVVCDLDQTFALTPFSIEPAWSRYALAHAVVSEEFIKLVAKLGPKILCFGVCQGRGRLAHIRKLSAERSARGAEAVQRLLNELASQARCATYRQLVMKVAGRNEWAVNILKKESFRAIKSWPEFEKNGNEVEVFLMIHDL